MHSQPNDAVVFIAQGISQYEIPSSSPEHNGSLASWPSLIYTAVIRSVT